MDQIIFRVPVSRQRRQLLGVEDGRDADRAHRDAAEAADEERTEDVVVLILEIKKAWARAPNWPRAVKLN